MDCCIRARNSLQRHLLSLYLDYAVSCSGAGGGGGGKRAAPMAVVVFLLRGMTGGAALFNWGDRSGPPGPGDAIVLGFTAGDGAADNGGGGGGGGAGNEAEIADTPSDGGGGGGGGGGNMLRSAPEPGADKGGGGGGGGCRRVALSSLLRTNAMAVGTRSTAGGGAS